MSDFPISRRGFVGGATGLAALGLGSGLGSGRAFAAAPASPVTLNIVDVAGNLALTQPAIEAYQKARPNYVSRITFTKAPAPELPGKIKAMRDAGRMDIDMVLTGTDALAAGLDLGLWTKLLPDEAAHLPKLADLYLPGAAAMLPLAQGCGVIVTYYPSGPLLEYMPDRVKTPPTSAEELLDYTKQNPNRFIYARPANSGPGRTFLMGLPYILGDKDPKDPEKGWDKTWAYLAELGKGIEYYPSGTGATMKELGEGTRDMLVSTTGWDINPRVLGVVPQEAKITSLKGFHWVTDAHYMVVPKGVSADKLTVLLDLMSFMLEPKQQAVTFDQGYFYPGPAVKGVTIDMAPPASQDAIKQFGRAEYEALIASAPLELPLDPGPMVKAFRRWDEQIGAGKAK
jgi:putative spermidine/putrescine transport system substrate-binding protein